MKRFIMLLVCLAFILPTAAMAKTKKKSVLKYKIGETMQIVARDARGGELIKNVVVVDIQERRSTATGETEYWLVMEEAVIYILPQSDERLRKKDVK